MKSIVYKQVKWTMGSLISEEECTEQKSIGMIRFRQTETSQSIATHAPTSSRTGNGTAK